MLNYYIMLIDKTSLRIASFDIGSRNFAFYIEEIDIKQLLGIKNIQKGQRYNLNGTPTPDFNDILDKVYSNGKKILLQNVDLTKGADKTKYFDFELCYNMVDTLNKYSDYWDSVDFIIVEQQMSFGKKINTMALKLAQHCESYFINKYGRCDKKIIEFPAYHKTQILGSEKIIKVTKTGKTSYKNIDSRERKKWAIEQALLVLSSRGDIETIDIIEKSKKKDDLSDVIIQLQAFKYLYFVDSDCGNDI